MNGTTNEGYTHSDILTEKQVILNSLSGKLHAISEDINLPKEITDQSQDILRRLIVYVFSDSQKCAEEFVTCSLYIAIQAARKQEDSQDDNEIDITLNDVLQAAQLNVRDFFKAMELVKEHDEMPEKVHTHFLKLEKKFCIMAALFHTFERICAQVFQDETVHEQDNNQENSMPPTPGTEGVTFRKKLIWTIFLHAKRNFINSEEELVRSVHLLLCCVEYNLRLTPSFLLKLPYKEIRIGCSPEHQKTGLLAHLASQFDSCLDDVQSLQKTCTDDYFQHLSNIDDLDKLTEMYESEYRSEGGLNDLLFLSDNKIYPSIYPSSNKSSETKNDGSSIPMTPVRAALNTLQNLKKMLNEGTDEPSANLNRYFDNCTENPKEDILNRLNEMKKIFVERFMAACNSDSRDLADQRFNLAIRLYYRVMEAMLNSEHKRISETDFSRLLNKDSFHRSMVACAVEILLVTYSVSWNPTIGAMSSADSIYSFPWILDVFNIQAYEFWKVIDSFIKAESKLTNDIVKHLKDLETKTLEFEVWKKGSILYEIITKSDVSSMNLVGSQEPQRQPNEPQSQSSVADLYLSPVKSRSSFSSPAKSMSPLAASTAASSPSQSSISLFAQQDGQKSHISHSLQIFFYKVSWLGYNRLLKLCQSLQVPDDLMLKIWTCFQYCITHPSQVLENRHIDQIMMCSIYGICRVVDKEIKFKTIVQAYKTLYHAVQEVYKNAYIQDKQHDSIIGFYNKVFMKNMKQFILQFAHNKLIQPHLSPVPKEMSSPASGPKKYSVPGRNNFYVSPLKESPYKSHLSPGQMTPRTKRLYCFGALGSGDSLRSINEEVDRYHKKQTDNIQPRGFRKLQFDEAETDDGPSVAKSPRVVKSKLSFTEDERK